MEINKEVWVVCTPNQCVYIIYKRGLTDVIAGTVRLLPTNLTRLRQVNERNENACLLIRAYYFKDLGRFYLCANVLMK